MRLFWIGAALSLIGLLALLHWSDPLTNCDTIEAGGSLHLCARGADTMRARFCYAADCWLIAEQMNKVEGANWRCE